ncbi:MAG TPA: 2Fe-2S iron-sulfur cluster-binding protein [Dehalococcoidia bacterium]|nr:2Fe-2S iron-sulfur cluster-binding protein [Dehalococcoidia bacterium]
MTKILVMPAGIVLEARLGETIMEAAQRLGYYWPTTCGGQGVCTTCLCEVEAGGGLLAAMGRSERKTLAAERGEAILGRPVRLACQATVLAEGEVCVAKPGVRSAEEA